jgi:glycosyltransferase involved in cell wall biosynthesis
MPDRRLRVLRVIARMNVGGPALQVSGLIRGLDPMRFEHRVLAGRVGPDETDFAALRAPDLPLIDAPDLGRSVRAASDVRALSHLVREMRQFRPDIVHTHTAKAGALGRLAAAVSGVPAVVHTFHGHLLRGYFSPAVTRAVVQTERALARRSDRLVAVGGHVRDDLLAARIGKPQQYVVVAPGLELPAPPSRAAARAVLDLPHDAPVVTLVARLTQVKRPDRFLEVARAVVARHPDVVFAVCGDGELLAQLRQRAAPLGERVRFLGWRGDVETVYAATDVALLTSDNEGMPVSLIEAALSGVPAVTTDVGSACEVVAHGETGLVVDASVTALRDAVERLLSDAALRQAMGAAAAPRARALFGVQRLVADTEHLYEQIASEKGLPRA